MYSMQYVDVYDVWMVYIQTAVHIFNCSVPQKTLFQFREIECFKCGYLEHGGWAPLCVSGAVAPHPPVDLRRHVVGLLRQQLGQVRQQVHGRQQQVRQVAQQAVLVLGGLKKVFVLQ